MMRLPSPDSRMPFLNHVITGEGAPSGLQVMVAFPLMEALSLDLSGCFSKVGRKAGERYQILTSCNLDRDLWFIFYKDCKK